jgi:hypothetical protein
MAKEEGECDSDSCTDEHCLERILHLGVLLGAFDELLKKVQLISRRSGFIALPFADGHRMNAQQLCEFSLGKTKGRSGPESGIVCI